MSIFNRPDPPAPEITPANPPVAEKTPAELLAESLKPLVDKISDFDNRLTTMQEGIRKPVAAAPAAGEPTSVFDDENAAFAQRISPVLARQMELEARIVKNEVKAEYAASGFGDLWSQFEKEINAAVDSSPLVQQDGQGGLKALRGDPGYIRNCVDMILGRAARQAGIQFDGKKKSFFLETAGGEGNSGRGAVVDDGLTNDQRKVFARLGVSGEDAKKTMAKLKFVN